MITPSTASRFLLLGSAILSFAASSAAQSTTFTYQGRLQRDGAPVSDECDFAFQLFDAASGGEEVAIEDTVNALDVTDGVFTAEVDFGAEAFTGDDRWLQIDVRCPSGQGDFTTLTPRQPVTRVPYAISVPLLARDAVGNIQAEVGVTDEAAGFLELIGANGTPNVLLGHFADFPDDGLIDVYDANGFASTTISVNDEGAGHVELFSPEGDVNVVLGNLVDFPNHGFIGVYDEGELAAGMYVRDDRTSLVFADEKDFVADHPEKPGCKIAYASLEGPEAAIYHRGTARLAGGRGTIELPDHFAALANRDTITVQLTPHSLASLGVAVGAIKDGRIEIGELRSGKGSYDVYYVVHAVRRGFEQRQTVYTDEEFRRAFRPLVAEGSRPRATLASELP